MCQKAWAPVNLKTVIFNLQYLSFLHGLGTHKGGFVNSILNVTLTKIFHLPLIQRSKVKVGVLRPVQQPGSYWDRSSELPLVGLEPTEVTAYD